MAINTTSLTTLIQDSFTLIGVLISEFISLLTDNLLELIIVGGIIGFVVFMFKYIMGYIKKSSTGSMKMK